MEKIINIFGDSVAWGSWDEMGGWAGRLRRYAEKNNNDEITVYNLGVCGNNSEKLLKRFATENEARNPNIIIIAIGINDSQYTGSRENSRVSLDEFEQNLLEMIRQSKELNREIIFIGPTRVDELKAMPWIASKCYDNENISIYNEKIKEICEKNELPFIEMKDLLSNEDLEDGLHPNSIGHEKMFLRIKDFLENKKII